MQAAHVQSKSKAFVGLTDKVATSMEANEALLHCANQGRQDLQGRRGLLEAINSRQLQRQTSAQQRFKDTVTNKRLREMAAAQLREIQSLHVEKLRWAERSFPAFMPA